MKKKKTVSKLKKELDSVFSKFIRTRDCLATTGDVEYGVCITCGVTFPFAKLQCGHFQYRTHNSTRYDEKNCSAQCIGDNMFKQGEQYKHGKAIDIKWGEGTAEALEEQAKETKQFKIYELEEMIEIYKKKTVALKRHRTSLGCDLYSESS